MLLHRCFIAFPKWVPPAKPSLAGGTSLIQVRGARIHPKHTIEEWGNFLFREDHLPTIKIPRAGPPPALGPFLKPLGMHNNLPEIYNQIDGVSCILQGISIGCPTSKALSAGPPSGGGLWYKEWIFSYPSRNKRLVPTWKRVMAPVAAETKDFSEIRVELGKNPGRVPLP